MTRLYFVLLFILYSVPCFARSIETSYVTSGTLRARALAMGSAYYSIEDDFSAGLYNPGAFKINATRSERRYRIFFNPLTAGVGLYNLNRYDRDYEVDDKLTFGETLWSIATVFKGAVYTTPVVDIGVNLNEEIIDHESVIEKKRFFSIEQLSKQSFHSAFVNFKIASTVSFGIAGSLYNTYSNDKNNYKAGHTFGVMLNPNPKMKVGIAYNYFPASSSDARYGLESLENETVTSGVSYYPDNKTVLSLDLRNLNKEDKNTAREIHTGFERKFFDRFALRSGYYRKKSTKDDVISFGIGILPKWEKLSKYATSSRNDILSYTVIFEENGYKNRWHVFSLLLRY
ncbi:MAG: hypothetical protein JXB48_10670 [Candidatus Latescibacteria bacterium]|nr:hypothetical protein [Candidatus Latescibacterota bacterium]